MNRVKIQLHHSIGVGCLLLLSSGCGQKAGRDEGAAAATAGLDKPKQAIDKKFQEFSTEALTRIAKDKDSEAWIRAQMTSILNENKDSAPAQFNILVLDKDIAGVSKFAAKHPGFIPAHENLWARQFAEGDVDLPTLKKRYQGALKADSGNLTSRLGLAWVELALGDNAKALDLARQTLSRQPDAQSAFRVTALALVRLGQEKRASLYVERAIQRWPKDPFLKAALAELYMLQNDFSSAMKTYQSVIKMAPNLHWVKVMAGALALQFGDAARAAGLLASVEGPLRQERFYAHLLATAYLGAGQYTEAVASLDALLGQNSKDIDAHWNRGIALLRQQAWEDAKAQFETTSKMLNAKDARKKVAETLVGQLQNTIKMIASERRQRSLVENALAVCDSGAEPESVGGEQDRLDASWIVFQQAAQTFEKAPERAETLVRCAFRIVPKTPKGNTQACAPMKTTWASTLFYTLQRIEESKALVLEALDCDSNNPEAQQLKQAIEQKSKS